ncbi:MAG: flavodoxin family protein [Bacteroidales bacterium]|nr:flavodoxin family protein [Bacteroidales bacterium]
MKKALVVHQSKKGHTRKYGEEIGKILNENGLESRVVAAEEFNADLLQDVTHLFLGCWTSGLYLVLQHPDRVWIKFARNLIIPQGMKVGLFTTYKFATGSMFRAMKKHIPNAPEDSIPEWKSKNGLLSESDKEGIVTFIAG